MVALVALVALPPLVALPSIVALPPMPLVGPKETSVDFYARYVLHRGTQCATVGT